jgi:anti-sigma factor RsiW
MPSDPRVPTEPTLEELSAFIDHELDAAEQTRVAEHVAGCAACQARLDGLRQTAHAVRSLPMETPPRTFTIPAQRPSFRWAPVGWIGSAAVAVLLIAVGIQQLHLPGSPTNGASTSTVSGGLAFGPGNQKGAAAPVAPPTALTQQYDSQSRAAVGNATTIVDPTNSSRRLVLDTDSSSYAANGRMRVMVQLVGSPSTSLNSGDQGLTVTLVRNGQGVALKPVGVESWNGTPIFGGWYDLAGLPLSSPRGGDYRLEATWVIPDGSGRVLQASVPVQLTGS